MTSSPAVILPATPPRGVIEEFAEGSHTQPLESTGSGFFECPPGSNQWKIRFLKLLEFIKIGRFVVLPGSSSTTFQIRIGTKLVFSFLLIILVTSVPFSLVGVRVIGDRIVDEAQAKVQTDLNSARVILLNKLASINDVVRFTSGRSLLMNELLRGETKQAAEVLRQVRERERLDVLAVTDAHGRVLLRTGEGNAMAGDDRSKDDIVRAAIERQKPVASPCLISVEQLRQEAPNLIARVRRKPVDTAALKNTEPDAGMMLQAAAPILGPENRLLGIVYGGVLLNGDFEIVDRIKETVFQNIEYKGKDIGTATIFQDALRISTNVMNEDGSRAIMTRVADDVYRQVMVEGKSWNGRALVVNHWYIAAYESIRDLAGRPIGMLYVGLLEQKYTDLRQRAELVFLAITVAGAFAALVLASFISNRISGSINKLAEAAEEVAHGNLDARVQIASHDEMRELAAAFNFMATALKKRDQKLRDFTTSRIMESERLAHVGQLAAGVAHEINNPLQGIITYSHLMLEKPGIDVGCRQSLEKIVKQANRCRDIIRGLLDFSRQRKPDKRLASVNRVLEECIGLVDNQALFHNIKISTRLAADLPQVLMDPSQIQQIFMNLIINAAEAMHGQGQLTLTTRQVKGPPAEVVEVEFTDTGHGIKEEDLSRIFDPFFTTKEVGHGTGLGLAISYGIIKEHKGTISVESEVGKGSTFLVCLPVPLEKKGAPRAT